MLRITVVDLSDSVVVLRVEGRSWLLGRGTPQNMHCTCFRCTLLPHIISPMKFSYPWSCESSFADAAGIALLKELRSRGADLIRPTPLVAEQLKEWPSFDAA